MFKKILNIFSLLFLLFFVTSCEIMQPEINEGKDKQYEIYLLAQESGYTGTYDEWLESIKGEKGDPGEDGVSITSIEKTNTEGLIDTYTITFSNGLTKTYTITNGEDGIHGNQGENGLSAYELYCKYYNYTGTEEEWISDLINYELGFKAEYTVSFDTKGGSFVDSQKVEKGNKIEKPEDPIRDGYNFLGWYINDEKWSFIGYSVTEDMELEAKWEKKNILNLKYDDRYDVSNCQVEIINEGSPASNKVGYGVAENVFDDKVVTLVGNELIATGVGQAIIKIDGVIYEVNVSPALLSVFLLFGQSNMEGYSGSANQSIANINGQVYSTYCPNDELTTSNASQYVASALTGEYSKINVTGGTDYLSSYPINSLTEDGNGKKGADSAIAYRWNQLTNDKVWIINAAHGGTSINIWQEGESEFNEALALFYAVKETLEREIKSGHYILQNFGYFWCQGCADTSVTAEEYVNSYLKMHNSLKEKMCIDHDANPATKDISLQFAAIIPVRAGRHYQSMYREGVYTDSYSSEWSSFVDLQMSGPRVAQFWMGNNPELTDIHLVWGTGEEWVTKPDGTNGIQEYFEKYYKDGKVDYLTQTKVSDEWRKPTTASQLHPDIHYTQIAYNELGLRSAENLCYILGRIETPEVEVSVKLYQWDGYYEVDSIESSTIPNSSTLVVPVVFPIWKAKELTYSVSEGLSYEYYDLIANSNNLIGHLSVDKYDKKVLVTVKEPNIYRWDLINNKLTNSKNSGYTENEVQLISGSIDDNGAMSQVQYKLSKSINLLSNREWVIEMKGTGDWTGMLFASSANAYNEGLPYLFKTGTTSGLIAFGYKDGSTVCNYGVSINSLNLDYSQSHTYRFENHVFEDGTNMIYLYIDGVEIGEMNNYYLGGSNDQMKEVDWVNGINFEFTSLGTTSHKISGLILEYIQVWE